MAMEEIPLEIALVALVEYIYKMEGTWSAAEIKTGVNKGLLWRILHKKYRPSITTLKKLGFRKRYRDLWSMPVGELRWRLEHRETVQE